MDSHFSQARKIISGEDPDSEVRINRLEISLRTVNEMFYSLRTLHDAIKELSVQHTVFKNTTNPPTPEDIFELVQANILQLEKDAQEVQHGLESQVRQCEHHLNLVCGRVLLN